jgi:hypothetical protein
MRLAALALILLAGCAGSSAGVTAQGPEAPGRPGGPVARAATSTLKCIDANLSDVQVLGWLASNGYIATDREPWSRMFDNPPITGPRAAADTSDYVEFFRAMCVKQVVSFPDSLRQYGVSFTDWPPDSQEAFVRGEWRCGLFNLCGTEACECEGQAWTFEGGAP